MIRIGGWMYWDLFLYLIFPAKYKQEWDKARKSYWLEQLERNPNRFSSKRQSQYLFLLSIAISAIING